MSFCWNEINSGIKSLILILCIFSLMTLSLWDDVATKFLHAAGIISALYFLATPKKTITNNPTLLIFISLCLLGIVNIIWYSHYKVQALFIPMHIVAQWKLEKLPCVALLFS